MKRAEWIQRRPALRLSQAVTLLAMTSLLVACATTEKPWRTYEETVRSGQRERVAAHGRWERRGNDCRPKEPPRLEIAQRPQHGTVEFARKKRRPDHCNRSFAHATVYYVASRDYLGPDRFSYHRIDPESGAKRLVLVEIVVKPPKDGSRSRRKKLQQDRNLSRASVRTIQELLAQAGYEPGPADGVAGKQTRDAISSYQQAQGIPVTGLPSRELAEHLRAGR